jgi:hypothetical protein
MKRNSILRFRYFSLLPLCLAVSAQVISSNQPPQGPVSLASANQLSTLLSQLEDASQAAQLDLAKIRIEKWKADSGTKRQAEGNSESIQRNLKSALPEIISELRASPESLTSTFKLYRNLDALYDVFESVAESAGAFGSKDEFQSLENDVSTFERLRRSVAERMESLAGAKEVEVTRLRAALQNAQARRSPPRLPPRQRLEPLPPRIPPQRRPDRSCVAPHAYVLNRHPDESSALHRPFNVSRMYLNTYSYRHGTLPAVPGSIHIGFSVFRLGIEPV